MLRPRFQPGRGHAAVLASGALTKKLLLATLGERAEVRVVAEKERWAWLLRFTEALVVLRSREWTQWAVAAPVHVEEGAAIVCKKRPRLLRSETTTAIQRRHSSLLPPCARCAGR